MSGPGWWLFVALSGAALAWAGPAAAQEAPAASPGEASGAEAGDEAGDVDGSGGDDQSSDDSSSEGSDPPPIDLSTARDAPAVTPEQLDWLKPRRSALPQNPYAQTDFTAYALEWGGFKIGLAAVNAGVLPRVQLGTVPALDVLRVPNGSVKVNALRLGPVDVAAVGSLYAMPRAQWRASYVSGGLLSSAILMPAWSIHLGGSFASVRASGIPDLSRISPLLTTLTGTHDPETQQDVEDGLQAVEDNVDILVRAQAAQVHFATDVRFNRRDSLILQGSALVWGDLGTAVTVDGQALDPDTLPEILGVQTAITSSSAGAAIRSTYAVSAAWQFAWKRVDLRVGLGWSAVPFNWLLQSTELSYRFGGPTRATEARTFKGWRKNRHDLYHGGEAAQGAQ